MAVLAVDALLETLTAYEETFLEAPHSSIRQQSQIGDLKATIDALRKRSSVEDLLDLQEQIGEGGMGTIHLANQRMLGRGVAVKSLREAMRKDESYVWSLLREGWIMGALEHPNIPPVHDIVIDDQGAPLVLVKHIEGSDWLSLIGNEEEVLSRFGEELLSWNLGVLDSVCNAIKYAHSKHIVHRDLKPENVMIGAFGEVYVLDWGIAASLRKDPEGRLPFLGDSIQPAGTPCYMAPELLHADPSAVDQRTDVYLLGGLLYELLTGRPPHRGTNMRALVESILESRPVFPDGVPDSLQEICKRALQRDPADRYQSVDALQLSLREYQQHRASEVLSTQAEIRLQALRELVANEASDARAKSMAEAYGECRFAFQQALALRKQNAAAHRGLIEAAEIMVESALGEGKEEAAAAHMLEIPNPSPELEERLAVLRSEKAAQKRRFEHLERAQDSSIGNKKRMIILGIFVLVVSLPMVGQQIMSTQVYEYKYAILWQVTLLIGFISIWPRFELEETENNRLTFIIITGGLTSEILATLGGYAAGLPLQFAVLMDSVAWTTGSVIAVLAMGWMYLPVALGYFACGLVIARYPEYSYFAIAGGNFVLMTNASIVYRMGRVPRSLIRTTS